jgi:cobalt-precorrin 5A hydrolase/precorrin-3B C17-methyltransferase
VAEAAALLAAVDRAAGRPATLVVEKRKSQHATAAVARVPSAGRVSVTGIGPGSAELLTVQAREALRACDVVVGYSVYVNQVLEWFPTKHAEDLSLGQEVERARRALELARSGQHVALVCSGDAGVYGLAGLLYEELGQEPIDVEVLPGVTAAVSAAALLGAPLMADFMALSLSDLLTPVDLIRRRLQAAASADVVTVLYNPASRRRRALLAEAHQLFLSTRPPQTPAGLVRNAYRPDQSVRLFALGDLPLEEVDMFTTVVIGNSLTELIGAKMVTRRRLTR